jgi:hypothetical protein
LKRAALSRETDRYRSLFIRAYFTAAIKVSPREKRSGGLAKESGD